MQTCTCAFRALVDPCIVRGALCVVHCAWYRSPAVAGSGTPPQSAQVGSGLKDFWENVRRACHPLPWSRDPLSREFPSPLNPNPKPSPSAFADTRGGLALTLTLILTLALTLIWTLTLTLTLADTGGGAYTCKGAHS